MKKLPKLDFLYFNLEHTEENYLNKKNYITIRLIGMKDILKIMQQPALLKNWYI